MTIVHGSAFEYLKIMVQAAYWLAVSGSAVLLLRALFLLGHHVAFPGIPWRFQLQEVLEKSLLYTIGIAWLSLPVLGLVGNSEYDETLVIHHLAVLLGISLAALALISTGRKVQRSMHTRRELPSLTAFTWRLAFAFGVTAAAGLALLMTPPGLLGDLPGKVVSSQSAYEFPKLLGCMAFAVLLVTLAMNDRWFSRQVGRRAN